MITTPAQALVDAVGEDTAVSVLLWLVDIYDTHVLEFDGKLLSPSVEWLMDSLKNALIDGSQEGK